MAVSTPSGPQPTGLAGSVTATASSQLKALGEVVVEVVPERLAALSRTVLLSGMISGAKEGGALVLKTQMGELVIRSPQVLPTDRVLLLQIPPGAPPVRAQVSVMGGPAPAQLTVPVTTLSVPVDPVPVVTPAGLPMTTGTAPRVTVAPETGAGVAGSVPAAPSAVVTTPLASLLSNTLATTPLHALEIFPILPGTLLPAKIMALPQVLGVAIAVTPPSLPQEIGGSGPAATPWFSESQTGIGLASSPRSESQKPVVPQPPSIAAAVGQLREAGAPALNSLLASGLEDVIAHLPPAVFAPPPSSGVSVSLLPETPMPVVVSTPLSSPQKPTFEGLPKFANLPAVLTLPPGSTVTVQINSVTLPAQILPEGFSAPSAEGWAQVPPILLQPGLSQTLASQLNPQFVAPSLASAAPVVQSGQGAVVPASAQTDSRVVSSRPDPLPLMAEIVGTTPAGEPLATSAVGLIVLDSKAPLPVGTRLELSLVHVSEAALPVDENFMQRVQPDWASLQAVLAQAIGRGVDQPLRIPRAEAHLGSSTVFLLAAIKLGDGRALLTPEAESAVRQSSQSGMRAVLSDEIKNAAQSWTRADQPATPHTAASDWKTLSYPLPPDSALTRLALHLKTERESAAPDAPVVGQRLVLELEMTRLGPMLLDGLILGRRMDMVLRSQRRLPKELYDELRTAWRTSLNAMNWSGDLQFQTAADLWLSR